MLYKKMLNFNSQAAQRHDNQLGSGQERTNSVLRLRPTERDWTEITPMLEVRICYDNIKFDN